MSHETPITHAEILFMVEEAPLLAAIKTKALMVLLAGTQVPVDGPFASALGNLSLACRAHYEWYTSKIPGYEGEAQSKGEQ